MKDQIKPAKKKVQLDKFLFICQIFQIYSDFIFKKQSQKKNELLGLRTIDYLSIFYFIILYKKLQLEGGRINILLSFINEIIILITKFAYEKSIFLLVLSTILNLIFYLIHLKMPIYEFRTPQGKYSIGYKLLDLGKNQDEKYSIFYPTQKKLINKPNKSKIFWIPSIENFNCFVETGRIGIPSFLKQIIYFSMSFLQKIEIFPIENAKIEVNQEKLQLIIYIPGLGGNRNLYTMFSDEMASEGNIVCLTNPIEEINLEEIYKPQLTGDLSERSEFLRKKRYNQLLRRDYSVKKLLDFIYNEKDMKGFFEDDKIKIDYDHIVIGGHSFGGATALYGIFTDERITGGIFCSDPWFFPVPDNFFEKKINKPILSISSEFFNEKLKENKQKIQKFCLNNKEKVFEKILFCSFKGCDHIGFTDVPFILNSECQMFGTLRNSNHFKQIELHLIFFKLFLKNVILGKKDMQEILNEFQNIIKNDKSLDSKLLNIIN